MKDLIEALTIFLKYLEEGSYEFNFPTNCEHDKLWINVDATLVSAEDIARLDELSFRVDDEFGGFYSGKFGSC